MTDDDAITRRPTVALQTVSLVATLVSAIAASGSFRAIPVAVAGFAAFAFGFSRSRSTALDLGGVLLCLAVGIAALEQPPIEQTVVGAIAAIVAWELGHSAIVLGEQLGREATTIRLEAVHAVSSLLVGLVAGTAGFVVYSVAGGGQPVTAIVTLLLAAVLLTIGLGTRPERTEP
ncbi:DUF7519 family protein [Natronorubrum daqingense]|uniref:Uncharacterized protein n=1 Tax=Natronorubrum daqingense TaxID=588898 RepID=A0A1N7EBN7_9EURY|nr:hypothetical protein [Natronorubrum daqingense]APX96474.1 hypothetical protein BB347_07510 [Natronorubrum daqingense]SIR85517.1 hypothetical protein SAMN05421809_2593 [Natronorubrum daqingense]